LRVSHEDADGFVGDIATAVVKEDGVKPAPSTARAIKISEVSGMVTTQSMLTPGRVAERLQEAGYRGKISAVNERTWIDSGAHGWNFDINFYPDNIPEQPAACRSMMFDLTLGPYPQRDSDLLYKVCNEFSQDVRFAKAFVIHRDTDKLTCMQMDTLGVGGISDELIDSAISVFTSLIADFVNRLRHATQQRHDYISYHDEALKAVWGEEKEIDRAFSLYTIAAHGGFAGSQNNLGDMYERGYGCSESPLAAMFWYARSAERGEPTAYLSIASLLIEHENSSDILVTAAFFAMLAVERLPDGKNKLSAEDALETLSKKLSSEEFSRARELASRWKPLFQERRLMGDSPDDGHFVKPSGGAVH